MDSRLDTQGPAAAVSDKDYLAALQSYLAGGGEPALQRAYEIGRAALAAGTGPLGLARAHHAAVAALLHVDIAPGRHAEALSAAAEFYAECISPYEMTYRGFHEANVALRHFNEVLEHEATRIARALHGEAGQLLVAVYIALTEAAREASPPVQARLAKVTSLLDELEEQLRRFSHELRPVILDDLGLVPALQYLSDGIAKRAGLTLSIENGLEERLPTALESALYRVAQESLNNIARHARASGAWIRIARDSDGIRCTIRDDGIGFDADSVMARKGERGFGLIGMRERLTTIGGTLEINSAAGRGTEVVIRVPMKANT
jgi:signal transduction histidine kinase